MAFYQPSPQDGPISNGDTNTEEFLTLSYKVVACTKRYRHDWSICPFAHNGEMASRRDPRRYLPLFCCHAKQRLPCPKGDGCPYAHSLFEYWLHPLRFRTEMCQFGSSCNRPVCFFAHSLTELRCTGVPGGPQPLVAPPDMLGAEQQESHYSERHEHTWLLQRGALLDAGLLQEQQQQRQQQQPQQQLHQRQPHQQQMQQHMHQQHMHQQHMQQQQQQQHMAQAHIDAAASLLSRQASTSSAMQALRSSMTGDEMFTTSNPPGLPPRANGKPPLRITPPSAVDPWNFGPPSATYGPLTSPLAGPGLLERAHSMPAAVPWGNGGLSSMSASQGAALLQHSLSPGAGSASLLQSARSSGLLGDYGLGLSDGLPSPAESFLSELLGAQQQQQQQQMRLSDHRSMQQHMGSMGMDQQQEQQHQQQQQQAAAMLRHAFASAQGDPAMEELRRRLALELNAVTATGPTPESFAPTTPDLCHGTELLSLAQQLSREATTAGQGQVSLGTGGHQTSLGMEAGKQLSRQGSAASLPTADAASVASAGAISNASAGVDAPQALANSRDAFAGGSVAEAPTAVPARIRPNSAPSSPVTHAAESDALGANSISYIDAPGAGESGEQHAGSSSSTGRSLLGSHELSFKLRQLSVSSDGSPSGSFGVIAEATGAAAAAAAAGNDVIKGAGHGSDAPIGAEAAAQLLAGLPQNSVMQLLSLVAQQQQKQQEGH